MFIRATSFKNLAARLLLVPIVAGGAAGSAAAQTFQSTWKSPGSAPAAAQKAMTPAPAAARANMSRSASAKDILKQGRAALAQGMLEQAQDLCVQADQAGVAQKYGWGFFEDTPRSLRKDITEARSKMDKAQAAKMLSEAKMLVEQKASSDAARMQNLDTALNKAFQAESLHGPYGVFDFDKPGSLIAAIKSEQEELRKKTGLTLAPSTKAPTTMKVPPPDIAAAKAANPAKADVLRVVAEGRMLLAQDKVLDAKARGDAARKMAEEKGVLNSFAAGDDSPDALITACKVKGDTMVKSLMADADKQVALGEWARADAACTMALQLAGPLGMYPKPIVEKQQMITKRMPAPVAVTTMAKAPTGPVGEFLVPAVASVPAPAATPMMPNPAPMRSKLVEQAASEMKYGNYDVARTCAIQAINTEPASKEEATAILRQIDIEIASKKRKEAGLAYTSALAFYSDKDFARAQALLQKINPTHLSDEQKITYQAALAHCTSVVNPVKLASADDLKIDMQKLDAEVKKADLPPILTSPVIPPRGVTPLVDTQKAAADVLFEKLRSEAISVMKSAGEAWGRGETDACMKTLEDFAGVVKTANIAEPRKAMILKPIDVRLRGYAVMKHNYDFELKEAQGKVERKNELLGTRVAEAQLQEEIKKKVVEIGALQKAGKYKDAEALALQAHVLDPEDPSLKAIYEASKFRRRVEDNKRWAKEDEQFNLDAFNSAERTGPFVDTNDPLKINPQRAMIAARRGEDVGGRARTEKERILEGKLSASYPLLKFDNMPLKDVLSQIHKTAKINITIDEPTLEDEKLSLDSVIINEELADISLDSALKVILSKGRLVHIIENDVVTITTQKRTRGKMRTKVFHVMDLVTPIPEYKLSPHHTLGGAIEASKALPPAIAGISQGQPAYSPRGAMQQGELISGQNSNTTPASGGAGGQLISGASVDGPNAMTPQRTQYARQLVSMVTQMVNQGSWAANGNNGGGTIAYYDIGGAMVVNQTADVISEVQALLDNLRRLQDLSVAVEIRVISLSEAYFERIGVDFSANITTNNTNFEQQLSTGNFRPQPFLNSLRGVNGVTTGYSPATGFTSDLGIPIRPTSYNLTAPPFGGYQNSLSPTLNGGLSLGLAFLNDIQVYMFLEAAAGNRRINIMQAPKITLFNGQTSTVFVGDLAYFATGLQVYSANGQFVYLPVNQAFPIGQGFNPNGTGNGTSSGVSVTVQAVISADRRFVRLNLTPSLTALASATVPLYPITTFITPVFEGGSQGQPIPFTQFFQQPSFTEISAQTTVAIPDGGTVLLGGLKTMAQGRNEFGPPVLSNVPYLNRLFKNVGIGQETRHVMLMVTPRIIINSEEEARQTGDGIGGGLPPQQ